MKPTTLAVATLFLVMPTLAENGPNDTANVMAQIRQSHIDANVPDASVFDAYLKRDLTTYFCKGANGCAVEYEMLRREPTQSGISYPKYYLWVRSSLAGRVTAEGAVRVAAMDKVHFDVTTFVTASEVVAAPERVGEVFPAVLVGEIARRARLR